MKEESGEKFPDLESFRLDAIFFDTFSILNIFHYVFFLFFRAEWRRELGDRSGESPASDRGKIIHVSGYAHCKPPMYNYARVYIFLKAFPIVF